MPWTEYLKLALEVAGFVVLPLFAWGIRHEMRGSSHDSRIADLERVSAGHSVSVSNLVTEVAVTRQEVSGIGRELSEIKQGQIRLENKVDRLLEK